MTSSSRGLAALALLLLARAAQAGLGHGQPMVDDDAQQWSARHATQSAAGYTLHVLHPAAGGRLREYVNAQGTVFAVAWNTPFKPDLARLLGDAYARYSAPGQLPAGQRGIQRSLRHESSDLVVQSNGHLHLFTGYAYRPSLLPLGFGPAQLTGE